jgi:hypothetical protein
LQTKLKPKGKFMQTLDIEEKNELLLLLDDASQRISGFVFLKPESLTRPEFQEWLADLRSQEHVVNPWGYSDMLKFTSKGRAHYSRLIAAIRRLP